MRYLRLIALLILLVGAAHAQSGVGGGGQSGVGGGGGSGLPAGPTSPPGVTFTYCTTPSGGVAGAATTCWPGITVTSQTGTYPLAAVDRGAPIQFNCPAACTATIPDAGGTNFQFGYYGSLMNLGTATVTVNNASSSKFNLFGSPNQTLQITFNLYQGQVADFYTSPNNNYEIVFRGSPTGCVVNCYWYPFFGGPSVPSNSQGLASANQPGLVRFSTSATNIVTQFTFNVITPLAATTGDIGIYGNCTTTCTLLTHTGSFSTAATGIQTISPASVVTLPAGMYYLGFCDSSATPQFSAALVGSTAIQQQLNNPKANTAGFDATDTCTTGILPNTFTITNVANNTGVNGWPFVSISN